MCGGGGGEGEGHVRVCVCVCVCRIESDSAVDPCDLCNTNPAQLKMTSMLLYFFRKASMAVLSNTSSTSVVTPIRKKARVNAYTRAQ